MNRVSFRLPDVGLREIRGRAHVEDGFLVLVLEDAFLGMGDVEKTTVKVDPQALHDLWIKRGIARDRLVLEPKRTELLETIPGNHRTDVRMRVPRKQRRQLEGLVDDFERLSWR